MILTGFALLRGSSDQPVTAQQATDTTISDTKSDGFPMYGTLAGKMARMEELMNGIDRFLGDPDFASRLKLDAEEFHELLAGCRDLFPENLPAEERVAYQDYIDRALEHSNRLKSALDAQNESEAITSLEALDTIRRKSHAKFPD
ncbi:MAG: hypothetical protein AAGA96_11165 [Verrucomicrobiota bacterium]